MARKANPEVSEVIDPVSTLTVSQSPAYTRLCIDGLYAPVDICAESWLSFTS